MIKDLKADKFIKWIQENDKDYEKYLKLVAYLEEFLSEEILTDKNIVDSVLSKYFIVLKNCDEITYDEEGVATAYTIIHFLERYRRFQIIILEMIKQKILKIKDIYKVLDIGTGPSPALFAFSDIYALLKEYIEMQHKNYSSIIEYNPDYVERSCGFRNWLHNFVEFLWSKEGAGSYLIPFHHGSFRDFIEIKFQREFDYSSINGVQFIDRRKRPIKYRYNNIFYSNILTSKDTVDMFEDSIIETAKWALNGTNIVIVGAKEDKSIKYSQIYESVDRMLDLKRFDNNKFIASINRVEVNSEEFKFSYTDKYGKRLKEFHKEMLNIFLKYVERTEYSNEFDMIELVISDDYKKVNEWDIKIYKKKSKLRRINK